MATAHMAMARNAARYCQIEAHRTISVVMSEYLTPVQSWVTLGET